MCEEKKRVQNLEEENQPKQVTVKQGEHWRKVFVLTLVCVMALSVCASAEGETGMAAVAAQASTATTWISNVFDMITGNAYLATLMAFGLLGAAIRIFRRAKRAVR